MYKRLTISLVLMGLAAFSIAAAVAYFAAEGRADVTITSATVGLSFAHSDGCTEDYVSVSNQESVSWHDLTPGARGQECISISNSGDVGLHLYVDHRGDDGSGDTLNNVIEMKYESSDTDFGPVMGTLPTACGAAPVTDPLFDRDLDADLRGCSLGFVAAGDEKYVRVNAAFPETNEDQSEYADGSLTFEVVFTGYSTP